MNNLVKQLRQLPDTYDFDEAAIQTCNDAANKIIELEGKVKRLEKRVSDAGWEAEARREADARAWVREWK